ncbi:MAG: DoxX family protein [Myxococcota bacterium]
MGFLDDHRDKLYAVLRIVAGFLFLWHGSQKLFGWPGGGGGDAPALITYVAGPIELVGGALLLVGLLVRPVAFLCSGLMAAAYWMAHGTNAVLPIMNRGELAMLYCFLFLFIAAEGAGIWSIDNRGKAG